MSKKLILDEERLREFVHLYWFFMPFRKEKGEQAKIFKAMNEYKKGKEE